MKARNAFYLACVCTVISAPVWAEDLSGPLSIDTGSSPVEFLAVGKPGFLKIHGEGAKARGSLDVKAGKATGTVQVALKDVTTGMGMRDHHMKDKYLEVEKYPDAILTIKDWVIPKEVATGAGEADSELSGTMKIHGVEKPVKGTAHLKRDGQGVSGKAHFELKITDFGISIPTFAGVTVADHVDIDAALLAKPAK